MTCNVCRHRAFTSIDRQTRVIFYCCTAPIGQIKEGSAVGYSQNWLEHPGGCLSTFCFNNCWDNARFYSGSAILRVLKQAFDLPSVKGSFCRKNAAPLLHLWVACSHAP